MPLLEGHNPAMPLIVGVGVAAICVAGGIALLVSRGCGAPAEEVGTSVVRPQADEDPKALALEHNKRALVVLKTGRMAGASGQVSVNRPLHREQLLGLKLTSNSPADLDRKFMLAFLESAPIRFAGYVDVPPNYDEKLVAILERIETDTEAAPGDPK